MSRITLILHRDKNSDQKTSCLCLSCTETDFKHKFSTGRPSPRFNDPVGGSSQTGGQPGGSSQTGGQPGGSTQTGDQPGGSSQTGGQPGGSSQTGGTIGIKPAGTPVVFIALSILPFVIFAH